MAYLSTLSDLDPSLIDADSEQIYIPKVLFEHDDFKGLNYKEILVYSFLLDRLREPLDFIQKGYYNGKYLPFIQQESTFWTASLLKTVDLDRFRSLKLAGDYYLWKCFSIQEELSIASCLFAGFRKQAGQLSEAKEAYMKELRSFCPMNPNAWERAVMLWDRVLGGFPTRFNAKIIRFDFENERWGIYEK